MSEKQTAGPEASGARRLSQELEDLHFTPPSCENQEPEPPKDATDRHGTLLPPQDAIDFELSDDGLTLTQVDGRGEQVAIFIPADFVEIFIDRLTDALGYGSCP